MNTDYQDIKSYKKPNICGNLCPNLSCTYFGKAGLKKRQHRMPGSYKEDIMQVFQMRAVAG